MVKLLSTLSFAVVVSAGSVLAGAEGQDGWRTVAEKADERFRAGAFNEAVTLWNTALVEMDESDVVETSEIRREAYRSLATSYAHFGQAERAAYYRSLFVCSLRAAGALQTPASASILATALQTLAREYEDIGRWNDALEAIRESAAIRSEGGATSAIDSLELARHYQRRGMLKEAEEQYLSILKSLPAGPPTWADSQVRDQYGELLVRLGREEEARKLFDEARLLRFRRPAESP